MPRLYGRIALVSGASQGIGAAVAKRFAAEGATVILAARNVARMEEVDDAIRAAGDGQTGAVIAPTNLAEGDEIDRLALAVAQRFGRLDILVANAAILGTLTPMHQIARDAWDQIIAVNLTANWRLIRDFDPLLRASDSGRAIFVTSGAARGVHPYWGGYAVTKAALEAMVRTWAGETAKTTMRINLVDPGAVRTAMRAAAFPGEDPATLPVPEAITDAFVALGAADCAQHGKIITCY